MDAPAVPEQEVAAAAAAPAPQPAAVDPPAPAPAPAPVEPAPAEAAQPEEGQVEAADEEKSEPAANEQEEDSAPPPDDEPAIEEPEEDASEEVDAAAPARVASASVSVRVAEKPTPRAPTAADRRRMLKDLLDQEFPVCTSVTTRRHTYPLSTSPSHSLACRVSWPTSVTDRKLFHRVHVIVVAFVCQ